MGRLPVVAASLLALVALSACNSTQDVLEPSAIAVPAPAAGDTNTAATQPAAPQTAAVAPPAVAEPAPQQPPAPSPQTAAVATKARVQFAPIVGTSVEAATALTERLTVRAREKGIVLARSTDTATTHVLKGYFTPLVEGKETTVIYVWDVYDPAGNRIHRITGQQKAPSAGGEGWTSVSSATMQTIGDATIDQLAAWLTGRAG